MIKIIPYSEKYKDDVISLILNIWENEFDFKGLERPDIYDIAKYYQSESSSNFWIAVKDNTLIGTVGLKKESNNLAYLKRMVVKKEFRKQGIGIKLLETAIEFAKEHNYKTIFAGTVKENPEAISFYKNHGFIESDIVPENITAASDSICLKLDL